MNKILQGLVITVAFLSVPVGIAVAGHLDDGINQIRVTFRNITGVPVTNTQAGFNLSSVALSDTLFMSADGMDTDVKEAGEHVGFMPGTDKVQMLACFNNAAGNETAACNNTTVGDVTLPITGSNVYEVAADNQFRILHVDITTATDAVWTVEWQYWDGASYVPLANVSDGTAGFTNAGLNVISFDFPAADLWGLETLHAVEGYWIRAEITAFTSLVTPPTAEQVWYETGRWWVLLEEITPAEEVQFDVHLDVPASDKTFHYYFPHTDGITVANDVTVQLTGAWVAEWTGYFNMTEPISGSDKKIAFKNGSVEITIPAEGIIQAKIFETP